MDNNNPIIYYIIQFANTTSRATQLSDIGAFCLHASSGLFNPGTYLAILNGLYEFTFWIMIIKNA